MSTHQPASEYRPPVAPAGLGYVPEGYLPPAPVRRIKRPPWPWLILGVVAIVAVAATVTAVILARRWDGRPAKGDTAFTLRLTGPDGGRPSAPALEQTKQILLSRMQQLDLTRPTVTAIGTETLLVTAARASAEEARKILVSGNLTFRKVLASTTLHRGESCKADPQERTDRATALASAKAKLGAAYPAAAAVTDPYAADTLKLTGFDTLTCAEVAALPPAMQYAVPTISCAMLDGRPAGTLDDASAQVSACDTGDLYTKYLLDVAKVLGTDLASAKADLSPEGSWQVTLSFTTAGRPKFTALTQEAMDAKSQSGHEVSVALLMDNAVVIAPTIQAVITGEVSVYGGGLSTRDGARALAATLSHGVLPLRLVITATETVR